MADLSEYRPRLSVEITEEQNRELTRLLGNVYGLRKLVFSRIIDDLIVLLNHEDGPLYLAAFISGKLSLQDFLGISEEIE